MDRYGAFRVVGELGRGGMGVVYLGVQDGLGRLVAIKVLPTADDSLAARLRHEADVLADLQHPHVVGVLDVGETNGRPYLVMPYFPGGTLSDVLRRDGALTPGQVSGVVAAMAEALSAAHARGVLHRDVKPGNVLLSGHGDPYLADFGIATGSSQTKTSTGELLGTVGYVAPETIAGAPASAATDVYALGVLGYTALAGRGPVVADNIMAALEAARTGRRVPLEEAAPAAPAALVALLGAAMGLDPAARPTDLRAYAQQLRSAVPPESVTPMPDVSGAMLAADAPTSMGGRAAVVVDADADAATVVGARHRRRTAVLAGAAGAALLATGAAAFFWLTGNDSDATPDSALAAADSSPSAQASASPSVPADTPSPRRASAAPSASASAPLPPVVPPPGGEVVVANPAAQQPAPQQPAPQQPAPQQPAPAKATTAPPKPALQKPGAVVTGTARFTQVTGRVPERQDVTEVAMSVSWSAPSGGGVVSSYELRRSLVTPSGRTAQATGTVSGRSTSLRVPACNPGGSRYSWEVRARNAAGSSAWTELSAGIIDMRGQSGFDAVQMIRTSGAFVAFADGGSTPAPSREQAYQVYAQSPASGTLAPGSSVRLSYYGEYTPPA